MNVRNTILIVDDNKDVRDVIKATLMPDAYQVYEVSTGRRIIEVLKENAVDLVLLDIGLPDGNGLSFIPSIRLHTNVPIIILSGRDTVSDKAKGLESGADDYIAKPFHPDELRARIRAGLRRYGDLYGSAPRRKQTAQKIRFFNWMLDRQKLQVGDLRSGRLCDLTFQEYQLLEALILEPNRVLRREELLTLTGEENSVIKARAIDVRIARIRKKLGNTALEPQVIKTVRGVGYMLECETQAIE